MLDRVDQFEDFDPRRDLPTRLPLSELTDVEREAAATQPDDVELDLG